MEKEIKKNKFRVYNTAGWVGSVRKIIIIPSLLMELALNSVAEKSDYEKNSVFDHFVNKVFHEHPLFFLGDVANDGIAGHGYSEETRWCLYKFERGEYNGKKYVGSMIPALESTQDWNSPWCRDLLPELISTLLFILEEWKVKEIKNEEWEAPHKCGCIIPRGGRLND